MKILIIKLSSIGDIVHTIPALSLLKQLYPGAQIDWMLYKNFASLLEDCEEITTIQSVEHRTFSSLMLKSLELRKEKYDLVIDFQGLIKTALASFLISGKRLGFAAPRETIAANLYSYKAKLGPALDRSKHVIEKNLELALRVQDIFESSCKENLDLKFSGLAPETLFSTSESATAQVCIIPCTTWQSKFWLPENWAKLIETLFERLRAEVNILGTDSDLEKIKEIVSILQKQPGIALYLNGKLIEEKPMAIYKLNILTKLSLKQLAPFFRSMDIVLGVDTGPLHIAAASSYMRGEIVLKDGLGIDHIKSETLDKKIIGLFGPSSGTRTGPYGFAYLSVDEKLDIKVKNDRNDMSLMRSICVEDVLNIL